MEIIVTVVAVWQSVYLRRMRAQIWKYLLPRHIIYNVTCTFKPGRCVRSLGRGRPNGNIPASIISVPEKEDVCWEGAHCTADRMRRSSDVSLPFWTWCLCLEQPTMNGLSVSKM